jgi:hypothetical protein
VAAKFISSGEASPHEAMMILMPIRSMALASQFTAPSSAMKAWINHTKKAP